MRSIKFHPKSEKASPIVVDEASRLTLNGAEQINVYQVGDDGKKIALLKTVQPGANEKLKLNNVNEILLESKGDFQSVIEGADKLDTTPLEVPVERSLTQTQQLKMFMQNENNMQQMANHELTWAEFKDLGDLDDGDEFYEQFNENLTKYEMQAEAIRQEMNPNRGNPISDLMERKHVENNMATESQGNTTPNTDQVSGQVDNET